MNTNRRAEALEALVFGLALVLAVIVGYYGIQRFQARSARAMSWPEHVTAYKGSVVPPERASVRPVTSLPPIRLARRRSGGSQ